MSNWYLVQGYYNGKQMNLVFYSDKITAYQVWVLMTSTGTGKFYEWGSGTWQITGPAAG